MAIKRMFDTKTLREFPKLGRYRIRLLEHSRNAGVSILDIREHLETEGFSGFTRRGIRIGTRREAAELVAILQEILEESLLPDNTAGDKEDAE